MKMLFKKCIVVLGFILFFALFSPDSSLITAHAKEIGESEMQTAETQAEIKLRVKTKALVKDTKYALKVYNLSENQKAIFKSSEPEIVSVNEEGIICGLSNGTAIITVTIKEGVKTVTSLTCEVTVGPPAINVKWTKSEITLLVGKRTTLKTILLPFNTAESAKFYSADTDIVTVSSTGKITAKAVGTTYVFTTIDNGKYDVCKVTVVEDGIDDPSLEEEENSSADEESKASATDNDTNDPAEAE